VAAGEVFFGAFGGFDSVVEGWQGAWEGGAGCDAVADVETFFGVFGGFEDGDYLAEVALEGGAFGGEDDGPGDW
jgi:hypothetical protein